jgi:hypothetical protein
MRAGIVVVIWLHLCFDRERSEEISEGIGGKGKRKNAEYTWGSGGSRPWGRTGPHRERRCGLVLKYLASYPFLCVKRLPRLKVASVILITSV